MFKVPGILVSRRGTAAALLVGIMSLVGCTTDPKELIDFDAATSMSRDEALKSVREIMGDDWAKDPFLWAGPAPACTFFGMVAANSRIKVAWENLRFQYTTTSDPPLIIHHWFHLNNGISSCKEGGTYTVELPKDKARTLATALSALGAKPY